MKHTRAPAKLFVAVLAAVLAVTMLPWNPAFAATYLIEGTSIPIGTYTDGSASYGPSGCWDFAQMVYKKIWGAAFTGYRGTPDDMLRNVPAGEAREINAANAAYFMKAAKPGAAIRVSNLIDGTDSAGGTYRHSQILVGADDNGVTVYDSIDACVRLRYYTWDQYVRDNLRYKYFKYIKFPGAQAVGAPSDGPYAPGVYIVSSPEGAGLNIRDGASSSGTAVLGEIPNGESVEVARVSGSWGFTFYAGLQGWIYLPYCEAATPQPENWTTATTLNFRALPSTSGAVLGTVGSGTALEITEKQLDASYLSGKTVYASKSGWIALYSFASAKYYANSAQPTVLAVLRLVSPPAKTGYYAGEPFNPEGISLKAELSDGVWKMVSQTADLTFSGYDDIPGSKTVVVSFSYGGVMKTASFTVEVKARPVPAVPSGVKAVSASFAGINIAWQAVPGATGYVVYRLNTASNAYERAKVTSAAAWTDTGLVTGRTYTYKVRAYQNIGFTNCYGAPSGAVSAVPVPAVPTDFRAVRTGASSVKLTWSSVAGASGYVIYRYNTLQGAYERLKVTKLLTFTDTGAVSPSGACLYKVRAYAAASAGNVYGNPSAAVKA